MTASALIPLILVSVCLSSVQAYFVEDVFQAKPQTKAAICFYRPVDDSIFAPDLTTKTIPYFSCINGGDTVTSGPQIEVTSCELAISSRAQCPLQFVRRNFAASPLSVCEAPSKLVNRNCTDALIQQCDGYRECDFKWSSMPPLGCKPDDANPSFLIPEFNQMLTVVYKCVLPRRGFNPYSNKRYDRKFTAY